MKKDTWPRGLRRRFAKPINRKVSQVQILSYPPGDKEGCESLAESSGLENRQTERFRGFESLTLCHLGTTATTVELHRSVKPTLRNAVGSNPTRPTKRYGNIAQLVEHAIDNREVSGSIPDVSTIYLLQSKKLCVIYALIKSMT